jgi:putative aldouronate transport system permease protein
MDNKTVALQEHKGVSSSKQRASNEAYRLIKRNWDLYLLIILPVLYIVIFKYVPMYGTIIAFKDFNVIKGIWGSPWVGFMHMEAFFKSPNFWKLIGNTLGISLYSLIVGFPAPIMLALALNELRNGMFKKSVQLITFAPHFISAVVMVSMIILFTSPTLGFINHILAAMGFERVNFLGNPSYFKSVYVWSEIWQNVGYGAVIYLAALAGINPQLYEAARVDGASRIQKIAHVDLPGILPTAMILLILNVGNMMRVGFEKIYLLQNPLNLNSSEIIPTFVYKIGLLGADFSFSAAVGLFNSVVNLILLIAVNYLARKTSESSLW